MSNLTELDVEEVFRTSVPQALLYRIAQIIVSLYAEAHQKAGELVAAPFSREIRPWLRRARIHEEIRALQDAFPGVRVEIQQPSGSTVTVTLEVGNALILVARAISPDMMIRQSNYRRAIATRSLQRSLFDNDPVDSDAKLYGVVLHGGDRGGPAPSFIVVRFPTADHGRYLDTRIDLLDEYTATTTEGAGIEQVVSTHTLALKPAAKAKKESDTA